MASSDTVQPDLKNQSFNVNFHDLATELAYNYFACSFGDERISFSEEKDKNQFSELIAKRKNFDKLVRGIHRTRNIIVVGAGASMNSYSGIPGGALLVDRVKSEYKHLFQDQLGEKFKRDKEEIEAITGKELNFENYLYILSKYYITQPEIRKLIKEFTDQRFAPVYFNELIAHMLKHSFVDAIINFNFEETLDQAILEEIGEGNYYNIITDGHCVDLDSITSDGTLKVPIYIKPHGTNSHKSTLRFTNKHYFDIPDDISTMLKCLIGGFESSSNIEEIIKYGESRIVVENFRKTLIGQEKNGVINKVNLIVVGFNMESIEFTKILNDYLPSESEIFYINVEKPKPILENEVYLSKLGEFFLSKNEVEWKKYEEKINSINSTVQDGRAEILAKEQEIRLEFEKSFKFLSCSESNDSPFSTFEKERCTDFKESDWRTNFPSLGRFFHHLFSDIWTNFNKKYYPQHIHRHKFVNLLFFEPKLKEPLPQTERINKHIELQYLTRKTFEKDFINKSTGRINYNYEYFLDRTIVELAINFLRGHGAIDYFELKHGRVDTYYKIYRETIEKHNRQSSPTTKVYSLAELALEFTNTDKANSHKIESNILIIDPELELTKETDKNDYGNFLECFSKQCNELIENNTNYTRNHGGSDVNKFRRKLTVKILEKLFYHKFISNQFKERIALLNGLRKVTNANHQGSNESLWKFSGLQRIERKVQDSSTNTRYYEYKQLNHLPMLLISANYLLGNNFYSISTHYSKTDLFVWQSFELRNQLHTNLKLDYEINKALSENKSTKNIILSVSEVGTNIKEFLKEQHKLNARYVQICSFEAVRQLYPGKGKNGITDENDVAYINRLISSHRISLIKQNNQKQYSEMNEAEKTTFDEKLSKVTLLLIPFTLHNHHMTFMGEVSNLAVKPISAVYVWRRGFSTQMNPIIIKERTMENKTLQQEYSENVKYDLEALYDIFIKYFARGLKFNFEYDVKDTSCELVKTDTILLENDKNIGKCNTFKPSDLSIIKEKFLELLPPNKKAGNPRRLPA